MENKSSDDQSERECMRAQFGDFVADYVFAPYADEVGLFPVILKYLCIAFIFVPAAFLDQFPKAPKETAGGFFIAAIALFALAYCLNKQKPKKRLKSQDKSPSPST
jgi:hypothetical protein